MRPFQDLLPQEVQRWIRRPGDHLPTVQDPIPRPRSPIPRPRSRVSERERDTHLNRMQACLLCASIIIGPLLVTCLSSTTKDLFGLPPRSGLFSALVFLLGLLHLLLFAYSIGLFFTTPDTAFRAQDATSLFVMDGLILTGVVLWIWNILWPTTFVFAFLYGFTLIMPLIRRGAPSQSVPPTPLAEAASFIYEAASTIFCLLSGSFLFPIALCATLRKAGDAGLAYAVVPTAALILANLISLSMAAFSNHIILWCSLATWTAFLVYLLESAPLPIHISSIFSIAVHILGLVGILSCRIRKERNRRRDLEARFPGFLSILLFIFLQDRNHYIYCCIKSELESSP